MAMKAKADAYWFPGWDKGHIYQQEEMLIKSQVTRMHVLNICVSNGFIYLLYMTGLFAQFGVKIAS